MTLRQKQSAFANALGQLLGFAYAQGYELTMADGSIDRERMFIDKETGKRRKGLDAHHMHPTDAKPDRKLSLHYLRLAQDINLFVAGTWISNGDHAAWKKLGKFWKTLHPLARWGGDFEDANHFSFEHEGAK